MDSETIDPQPLQEVGEGTECMGRGQKTNVAERIERMTKIDLEMESNLEKEGRNPAHLSPRARLLSLYSLRNCCSSQKKF